MLLHVIDGKLCFNQYLLACIKQHDNTEVRLILQDANCNATDSENSSLLHYATEYCNIEIMQYIIDNGCNVDTADNRGNTALIIAAKTYRIDIVLVLVEANASVSIVNKDGENAMMIAVDRSKKFLTRTRGCEISDVFVKKLKQECSNDSALTAKKLIEWRCPLNRIIVLKDVGVTKYMLDNGCDANDRDVAFPCVTAIQRAVSFSDLDNVKLLIERGADVNIPDLVYGRPPLHFYDMKSDETDDTISILEILLEQGASLDAHCNSNCHFLHGKTMGALFFEQANRRSIRTLIQHKVDLVSVDFLGMTLIHHVARNQNVGVTAELKGRYFDIDKLNAAGQTALMLAVDAANVDVVEFLLANGAQVNIIKPFCEVNALFYAFYPKGKDFSKKSSKCIEILLQYGANVQQISNGQNSLFDYVLLFRNFALIKPIIAHLALMQTLGDEITDFILKKINSHCMFRKYFDFCKRKLERMKRTIVYQSLTLFNILTEEEKTVISYMHNQKLLDAFVSIMYYKRRSNLYYYTLLRKQLMIGVHRKRAVDAVSTIMGLGYNSIIANRIVDYLNNTDRKSISKH